MNKAMLINAFSMNTVGHLSPGLWILPEDESYRYTDIEFWTRMARTLDQAGFDALFLADIIGVYDVYQNSPNAAYRAAAQTPVNDPIQIIPAIAAVTENLNFGLTASVAFEHPFPFARRMTTLDHLTKGRVGWNIVTSYLDSGARNLGQERLLTHDNRYDLADEYLEVCYKLWEGSWEDNAVIRDRENRIYIDPDRVHNIQHNGHFFQVPGAHLSEPSPQRTPFLFQAGASNRGRHFAAQHAEGAFVAAPSKALTRDYVADLRQKMVEAGRQKDDVKVFAQFTVIVAETDEKAHNKLDRYRQAVNRDGALALMSGWTGVDFSTYAEDDTITSLHGNAIQFTADAFSSANPSRQWTVRDIAEYIGVGGDGPVIVGSAKTVADALQQWQHDTDLDGFNLSALTHPQTFNDLASLLLPELQRRGALSRPSGKSTMRNRFFGNGDRLPNNHQGSQYRRFS